jgi:hypothetical protein
MNKMDRQVIVEHLQEQLRQGDKELIGNEGYRKYLQAGPKKRFTLDQAKVQEEVRDAQTLGGEC